MNNAAQDYPKLLTEVLQKQIIILGPEITLLKARNVSGLTVADSGQVTAITGDPKETAIKLLEQFRELSPLLVKKTMKQLLSAIISSYPSTSAPTPIELGQASQMDAKDESQPAEQHSDMNHESRITNHDAGAPA